jgi:hypothetical protein
MTGDCHVRFCERPKVKSHRPTHLRSQPILPARLRKAKNALAVHRIVFRRSNGSESQPEDISAQGREGAVLGPDISAATTQ